MAKELINPDYLFEVSWEVCNKVGGIYTVIATKSLYLKSQLHKHHILIGPDVWMDTESNPDFIEDNHLYTLWKAQAASEGLRVRLGRWNVPGKPIAILVDFKQYLTRQNDILTEYWKRFGVDSITGNWDYKENVLFGYAAGHVIESFYRFNLGPADKVVAQFHEWQTGSGLLYLKDIKIPVATVFTTHATVMGRCLAGNNLPLYDSMALYDGNQKAQQFGVVARHSIERISAQNADAFTTVSEITGRECAELLDKPADEILMNGFENDFVPSPATKFNAERKAARKQLLRIANTLMGTDLDDDTIIVSTGGRYEYQNKGINVFIDAMNRLRWDERLQKNVLAFVMVPAWMKEPRMDLQVALANKKHNPVEYGAIGDPRITHVLHEP
ncbi:MAG: glycogen/starch synthase, partial [Bacteroidales bacterium]|nr:glycogen/starch synthase [Bacteroidales bacterium]